jgi:DNA-binding transcriptional LysR family regulator
MSAMAGEAARQTGSPSGGMDRLRIRHMRLLAAIEAEGALGRAAEKLNLSQPAATKILQEVESLFGRKLFERLPRGVAMTPAGRAAIERFRVGLAAFDLAVSAADSAEGRPEPLLRLGLLPLVAMDLLPRTLAMLAKAGPLPFRLDLQEGTVPMLDQALNDHTVDAVMGHLDRSSIASRDATGLVTLPLHQDGLGFIARPDHPLARRRGIDPAEIVDADWVLAPRSSYTRIALEEFFLGLGLPVPAASIESVSFHTNIRIVAATDMIAAAPSTAIVQYQKLGLVKRLSLKGEPLKRPLLFTARRETMLLEGMRQFVAALRSVAAED